MLADRCPGPGRPDPGFLSPWLELPGWADRLRGLVGAGRLDLIRYGTTADADEIRDTAVAQPLLVAAGRWPLPRRCSAGSRGPRDKVGAVAGHSVGELAAGAIAGGAHARRTRCGWSRIRGRAMAEAAAVTDDRDDGGARRDRG